MSVGTSSLIVIGFFACLNALSQSTSMVTKFIALGDSYTIGESVTEKERWPVQLATRLRERGQVVEDPRIIAVTGWRTDQLKKAIEDANLENEYGLVSLLIGVNNQYQKKSAESYALEFEELLQIAIALANGMKEHVLVVSIPDYGFTPFGKKNQEAITRGIDQFNEVNREISDKMGIGYVDITDLTREGLNKPEYVAGDGLHPSGKMYSLWVERILEKITAKR